MKKILIGLVVFFSFLNISNAYTDIIHSDLTSDYMEFDSDSFSFNGGVDILTSGTLSNLYVWQTSTYILVLTHNGNVNGKVYKFVTGGTNYVNSSSSGLLNHIWINGDRFDIYDSGYGSIIFNVELGTWGFGGYTSAGDPGFLELSFYSGVRNYKNWSVGTPPPPTEQVLFDYINSVCTYDNKYKDFFSYVPFEYNLLIEVIPNYIPEGSKIFELQDLGETKLFTGLVGYNSLTGSFTKNTIYNTGSFLEVISREEILKYNFFNWTWGENLNQEIGGYSDRYTHFAINTSSGTYFNYLTLSGSWISTDQEKNNFIVEYFDFEQNNIVSFASLFDFGEKIQFPSLTRRVNIYFKDGSIFDLEKIDLGQVGSCTEINGEFIPNIIAELITTEPITPPDDTTPNLYIDDTGLENEDYNAISSDVVFFPADGTQASNSVTVPGECETAGNIWSEDYGCVRGTVMQFFIKIGIIVDNLSGLFNELLKLGSDEEKSFFSFNFIEQANAIETSTGYSSIVVGKMTEFRTDENNEMSKFIKYLRWGLLLALTLIIFLVSFKY